jgi:hypothetical protein
MRGRDEQVSHQPEDQTGAHDDQEPGAPPVPGDQGVASAEMGRESVRGNLRS